MDVVFASDHGGFRLKELVKKYVGELGFSTEDVGCDSEQSVDYPDFGIAGAEKVVKENKLGIFFCGTGLGISIAANKVKGARAALCHNQFTAQMAREHNDANILVMGGRVIGDEVAKAVAKKFLETRFSDAERHKKRLQKISDYEC